MFVLLASEILVAGPVTAAPSEVVYREGLSPAWADWSWGGTVDFDHQPGHVGDRSIGWRLGSPWSGVYLHSHSPVTTGTHTALRFALRTTDPTAELSVHIYGSGNRPVGVARRVSEFGGLPPAGVWRQYEVALDALGAAGQPLTGFVLQDAGGVATQPLVELDEVTLTRLPDASEIDIRPENALANHTRGRPTRPELFNVDPSFRPYYDKINGDFVGTTEQILAWAAKKWGFDRLGYPDLAKSMAVIESWWHQSAVNQSGAQGILQVHPGHWPDTEPARWSTAYNADYAMAVVRYLYDPDSWLGSGTAGSLRNAIAAWECGCGGHGLGTYATQVMSYNVTKPWLRPGQPPEWF